LQHEAMEGGRVSNVLTRLGIWNWGRFSGEYWMLFGELPSETVRSRRRSFNLGG
jgi:hypothetical protein